MYLFFLLQSNENFHPLKHVYVPTYYKNYHNLPLSEYEYKEIRRRLKHKRDARMEMTTGYNNFMSYLMNNYY